MKKNIFLLLLLFTAAIFTGCDKDDEVPAISRTSLKGYGPDFAVVQGRIYLTGDSPIKHSGACWVLKSTKPYDEKALEFATLDDFVQESDAKEPGIFQMRIKGLEPDTVYYIRLFATNDQGTFFSYPVRVRTSKIYDDLTFVEAGTYSMGSAGGAVDEMPVHKVTLEHNFFISTKEVTNAEYCTYLNKARISADGKNGGELWIDMASPNVLIQSDGNTFTPKAGAENKPAICVTWEGAHAYCQSRGGNLPTEAEWEFAAQGGLTLDKFKYAGSDKSEEVAWFSASELHTGGMKAANSLNLFDMSGNVAEWCSDWYSDKAYEESLEKNPEGPKSGTKKVIRGGSYNEGPVTITARSSMDPKTVSPYVGFRVVVKL